MRIFPDLMLGRVFRRPLYATGGSRGGFAFG